MRLLSFGMSAAAVVVSWSPSSSSSSSESSSPRLSEGDVFAALLFSFSTLHLDKHATVAVDLSPFVVATRDVIIKY